MSKMSEAARSKAKSKAERLVRADPRQRVDASGYMPEGAMNADVQTGPRVISRRQYASGGGVAGGAAPQRADRKPRATKDWSHNKPLNADELKELQAENQRVVKKGFAPYPDPRSDGNKQRFASGGAALTPDSLANTNVKEANQKRDGIKHDGGMKSGGRTGKMAGGALSPQQRMALGQRSTIPQGGMSRPMRKDGGHVSDCQCAKCGGGRVGRARGGPAINEGTRPVGGRLARKAGGRTKKGTTVNINIIQPPAKPPMPPMGMRPPGGPPPGGPIGMAQGMPPQGAMMPPPGAAGIPPAAPLMPRAAGGRTYPIETGSGGGRARLDKAARAARA